MKDQNKKVANLKHNQQLEKKKNAQLLEEVRRREDSLAESAQHGQVGHPLRWGPAQGRLALSECAHCWGKVGTERDDLPLL